VKSGEPLARLTKRATDGRHTAEPLLARRIARRVVPPARVFAKRYVNSATVNPAYVASSTAGVRADASRITAASVSARRALQLAIEERRPTSSDD